MSKCMFSISTFSEDKALAVSPHCTTKLREVPLTALKAKVPEAASPLSPRSRQLDLLDAVEEVRQPLAASSSHPNLPSFLVSKNTQKSCYIFFLKGSFIEGSFKDHFCRHLKIYLHLQIGPL